MARKSANDAKIARELDSLEGIITTLPDNPVQWAMVLRLVAPVIARLAIRYALKRLHRGMSEDKVNLIGKSVGDWISAMLARRAPPAG